MPILLEPCCGTLQSNTAVCCKPQPHSQANELGTLAKSKNPEINKCIGSSWLRCAGLPNASHGAPVRSVASSPAGCSQVGREQGLGAFRRIPAVGNENHLRLSSSSGASKRPAPPVPPSSNWGSRCFKSSSPKHPLGLEDWTADPGPVAVTSASRKHGARLALLLGGSCVTVGSDRPLSTSTADATRTSTTLWECPTQAKNPARFCSLCQLPLSSKPPSGNLPETLGLPLS